MQQTVQGKGCRRLTSCCTTEHRDQAGTGCLDCRAEVWRRVAPQGILDGGQGDGLNECRARQPTALKLSTQRGIRWPSCSWRWQLQDDL